MYNSRITGEHFPSSFHIHINVETITFEVRTYPFGTESLSALFPERHSGRSSSRASSTSYCSSSTAAGAANTGHCTPFGISPSPSSTTAASSHRCWSSTSLNHCSSNGGSLAQTPTNAALPPPSPQPYAVSSSRLQQHLYRNGSSSFLAPARPVYTGWRSSEHLNGATPSDRLAASILR